MLCDVLGRSVSFCYLHPARCTASCKFSSAISRLSVTYTQRRLWADQIRSDRFEPPQPPRLPVWYGYCGRSPRVGLCVVWVSGSGTTFRDHPLAHRDQQRQRNPRHARVSDGVDAVETLDCQRQIRSDPNVRRNRSKCDNLFDNLLLETSSSTK